MQPMRWVPILLSFWLALLVGFPALAHAGCAPTPPNLVAWWQGNGDVKDETGLHNGTLMNGTDFAPGRVGQAFSFDGVDDYVMVPSSAALDPTATASLVAWVYFDQLPSVAGHFMYVAGKSGGGTDLDIQAQTDNRLYFYVAAGFYVASTTVVQTGQWYHVVGTYTASNQLKMYVNGVLENTVAIVGVTRGMNGNPFAIGQSSVWGGRFFKGRIDEVSLFNRALSDSEVQGIYDAGGAGICVPEKVGSYRSGTFYLDANGSGTWEGCATDRCLAIGLNGDTPLVGDWNGSGTSKVSTFRPTDGAFYLDYNGNGAWDGCGIDRCLSIGLNGDIPLVGDWNGSGTSKVGTFRPTDGAFYLDYNGNGQWDGCGIDRCLSIGLDGDVPVVGDWNGSGTSKVGTFRPTDGAFYLDYNGNGQWDGCGTDRCLFIGMLNDIPLVGDWNGSGTAKVGTFRPSDGAFYLDYNGSGTWEGCGTDRCLYIGLNGDIPLVGDWNGSGTAKVGTFRPTDGAFYLDYNGSGTWEGCGTDRCLSMGLNGDTPLVGKW